MKVKIIKAKKEAAWYADKIGNVFEVKEDPTDLRYYVRADGSYGFIRKEDVILIGELADKFVLDPKLFEI